MSLGVLLAQVMPGKSTLVSPMWWDFLLVAGVIAGLTMVIFLVALLVKSRRQRKRKSDHGPEILKNTEEHLRKAGVRESVEPEEGVSRRRRRRRDHRPRNPTLAEQGGLPPVRDPDTSPHTGL